MRCIENKPLKQQLPGFKVKLFRDAFGWGIKYDDSPDDLTAGRLSARDAVRAARRTIRNFGFDILAQFRAEYIRRIAQ